MDSVSLYERFIASESNVHPSKLRSGNISQDELQQIDKAIGGTLYSLPITINDNAAIGMSYIRATCRLYHRQNKCGMVIIDYLQLITESSNGTRNREQEIARMSREAKIIAKELNVPVILLSQLNREVDKRQDKNLFLQTFGNREPLSRMRTWLYSSIVRNITESASMIHPDMRFTTMVN